MTNCADVCLDMYSDDGSPEFCTDKIVGARKPHRCCECGDVIAVKQKHERVVGKWDGEIGTYRTCLLCVEIRKAFVCGTFVFEQLWESISEEMFPRWNEAGPWDCLAKLTTDAAIAKCNARYLNWKADNE